MYAILNLESILPSHFYSSEKDCQNEIAEKNLCLALAVIACFSLPAFILPANVAFRDVAPSSWYEPAINQLSQDSGWYDWDEIPPTGERSDLPITRQLAVKVLMRSLLPYARGDYVTESAKITDFTSLDGRYYEAVLAAYSSGVVHGGPGGNFRPLDGLSRAEACTLF